MILWRLSNNETVHVSVGAPIGSRIESETSSEFHGRDLDDEGGAAVARRRLVDCVPDFFVRFEPGHFSRRARSERAQSSWRHFHARYKAY